MKDDPLPDKTTNNKEILGNLSRDSGPVRSRRFSFSRLSQVH